MNIEKPRRNPGRSKTWQIDFDYRDSLSPEDAHWLDRFTDEYYLNGYYYRHNTNPILSHEQAKERKRAAYKGSLDIQNIASRLEHVSEFQNQTMHPSPEIILLMKEELMNKTNKKKKHNFAEPTKSELEMGIRAYELATQILSGLTTDNPQLKEDVIATNAVLAGVLSELIADYNERFPEKA